MDADAVRSWYDKGGKDSKGKSKSAKGKIQDDKGKAKRKGREDKGKSKAAKNDKWCDWCKMAGRVTETCRRKRRYDQRQASQSSKSNAVVPQQQL
eukprot:8274652-Pyramimonas_sp.AAC.1